MLSKEPKYSIHTPGLPGSAKSRAQNGPVRRKERARRPRVLGDLTVVRPRTPCDPHAFLGPSLTAPTTPVPEFAERSRRHNTRETRTMEGSEAFKDGLLI